MTPSVFLFIVPAAIGATTGLLFRRGWLAAMVAAALTTPVHLFAVGLVGEGVIGERHDFYSLPTVVGFAIVAALLTVGAREGKGREGDA